MATHLQEMGIRLKEARVVADVEDGIVTAVRALSSQMDYVFTTGGIGPTHDDITAWLKRSIAPWCAPLRHCADFTNAIRHLAPLKPLPE